AEVIRWPSPVNAGDSYRVLVVMQRATIKFARGIRPRRGRIDLTHEEQVSDSGDDNYERYRTNQNTPNEAASPVKAFGFLHSAGLRRSPARRKQLTYNISIAIIIRIAVMALTR